MTEHVPLWMTALAFAALAPFGARGLARVFTRRVEARTTRLTSHLFRAKSGQNVRSSVP